jgi:hypothetical protein
MITVYGILVRLANSWHKHERRRLFRKLTRDGRVRVLNGPFEGLELAPDVDPAGNLSKVVGSYEAELHPAIGKLASRPPRTVINIGSAEGYYAVGLARLIPGCHVHAFEADPAQRERCTLAARVNGVPDRVTLRGKCDAAALARMDLRDSFLLVDCEGAEVDILDPSAVPALNRARMVVELHDAMRPGCGRIMYQRFSNTHDITFIPAVARDPSEYACLRALRRRDRAVAVEENRIGVQEWMSLTPRCG